jgi:hypothetical protein
MIKRALSASTYPVGFKRKTLVPDLDDSIRELFGVCLGDGCLTQFLSGYDNRFRHFVIFTGNLKDDFTYYKDYILPILREKFGIKISLKERPVYGSVSAYIGNKMVFDYFKKLGIPIGEKKDKIKIPKQVLDSSLNVKAAVLRGLFDTDGHLFARKDEGYRYPSIKITSASKSFLVQLKGLIREFGLPAYIHMYSRMGEINGGDVLIRGAGNVKIWMALIGTSHLLNKARYIEWLNTGKLLPKKLYQMGS